MKAILLVSAVIIASCTPSLSEEKFNSWIEDPANGLHSIRKENGLVYDLQFQPNVYLWLHSDRSVSYDTMIKSQSDVQQYILKIYSQDVTTDWLKSNYDEITIRKRIYYFSYLFQNDISLVENGIVQPCILYHLEQSQSTKATRIFLLGFENKFSQVESTVLNIHSEIISTLPIKIKISKQNIPSLKI